MNLDDLYNREKASLRDLTRNDPVEFLYRYVRTEDAEVAGFLGSQFAYGRIEVFKRFLARLFEIMGPSPSEFIVQGDFAAFEGLYYRFQKNEYIVDLFGVLKRIVDRYGGIGPMVQRFYQGDVRAVLWRVRRELLGEDGKRLTFFFPKPSRANPLKRWNLYLRWMVRKDEIDAGFWDFVPRDRLIIPLDTHIFKIGRCFGWTKQGSPSWKAACDITEVLRGFSPEDPLKYDFFLCHKVGIGAGCRGARTPECIRNCMLLMDLEGEEKANAGQRMENVS
ncbi:MAG: TIGR02757 family protein [Syntrophorhabdus aromaticivorans]|uniref:TIGR02757 family protein n=1 Tax=Syntrophorhabdus aromaticivorans TaxID=328301 RepID=A0A971M5K5_9BACT|nr:TIGR02757 family protein [Syntrophorhabdus aromaticivorans]